MSNFQPFHTDFDYFVLAKDPKRSPLKHFYERASKVHNILLNYVQENLDVSELDLTNPNSPYVDIYTQEDTVKLQGTLRSDKVYRILNAGAPLEVCDIQIPAGGLFIEGVLNQVGGLDCTDPNKSMFIGGGNLFIKDINLSASGTNASVFNSTDPTGFSAVEMVNVNFTNCKSIGTLNGYRQGLWENVAIFGTENGLTLSGTWLSGFAIFTTIVRSFDPQNVGNAVLKADPATTFGSRIISNANIQVDGNSIAYEFTPSNFIQDGGFQLIGGNLQGTGTYVQGITQMDVKSQWDSTGLPVTTPFATLVYNQQVMTTPAEDQYYVLNPTTVLDTSEATWVSSPQNGRLRWDSNLPRKMRINGIFAFSTNTTTEIGIEIRKYDGNNNLIKTISTPLVTTSNGLLGNRAENVSVYGTIDMEKDDYLEIWVANNSGSGDITVIQNSKVIIERI